jgi:hypothetical protein
MTDPTPGYPDHAAPAVKTVGWSPKMVTATAVTTVIGIVVAILNALQADPALFGDLPTPVQSLLLVIIPPILAGFATYQASPGNVTVSAPRPATPADPPVDPLER